MLQMFEEYEQTEHDIAALKRGLLRVWNWLFRYW
jgi:hypothetical protein